MRSPSRPAGKLSAREICILALMGALIFAEKVAFSAIPNVNLNAVLIILTTVFFGWRALCSVLIYRSPWQDGSDCLFSYRWSR